MGQRAQKGNRVWHTHVARHQAPLDEALTALQARLPAEGLLVVVRTAQQRTYHARRLAFPNQVLTLAELFALAGRDDVRPEDILPATVVRRVIERSLPSDYQGAARAVQRRHLAHEVEKARHLLAQNDRTVTAEAAARVRGDLITALLAANDALGPALDAWGDEGLFSADDVVARAATGPSRLGVRFPTVRDIALIGIETLSPMEQRAFENVAAGVAVHAFVVGTPPQSTLPPALAFTRPLVTWLGARGTVTPLEDTAVRAEALDVLFDVAPRASMALSEVHIARPRTLADEIDDTLAAVADLAERAVPLHHIGIVVPRLAVYAGVLAERLTEMGLPYAMSHPGQTRTTPSGTLLALLLDCLVDEAPRDVFLDLLEHPLVRLPRVLPDGSSAWADGAWLRRGLIARGVRPRGRAGWTRAFETLRRPAGIQLDDDGRPRPAPEWTDAEERMVQTAAWILDAVLDVRQAPGAASFFDRLRDTLDLLGLGRGLARAARTTADIERLLAGHRRVLALLDETEDAFLLVAEERPSAAEAVEALQRALWKDPLPPVGDPEHGVQVLGLRNARGARFAHVFLLGARQGDLPAVHADDALQRLLERATGADLVRLDEEAEARRIVHGILADTSGTVVLSCPREEDDAEIVPSVLLDEITDSYTLAPYAPPGHRIRSTRLLHRAAGLQGVALPAAHDLHRTAHAVVGARSTGDGTLAGGALHDAAVIAAVAERVFPTADPERAVSATRLDTYATCPLKAFFSHGMRLSAREARDEGLDARDKGVIIHSILHRYCTEAMARLGTPLRIAHDTEAERHILSAATDILTATHLESIHFDAFKIQLLGGLKHPNNPYAERSAGILARFLSTERDADSAILATEVPYGPDAGTPVSVATPTGAVPLRGRIDRIDVFPESGDLRVIDYKTGNLPSRKHLLGGINLQLALYAHVARALHPDRAVRQIGYVQLKRGRKQDTQRLMIPGSRDEAGTLERLLDEDTPRRIASMMTAARAGSWPLTLLDPKDAGCERCDHRRICALRPHLQPARLASAQQAEGPHHVPDTLHRPEADA